MGTHYNHFNEGNPDTLGAGKVISFDIVTSRTGLDTATLSVVTVPGSNAVPEGMTLGKTMPAVPGASIARPGMFCTSLGWRPDQGGSVVWTAQYQGIAVDGRGKTPKTALRVSHRAVIREEHFDGSVHINEFSGQDDLPVRFNNIIYCQRAVWVSTTRTPWPNSAKGLAPPSDVVPGGKVDGPWSGTFQATRVYPFGWVLRSFSEEQVAEGVELFTGEAEWQYEWKYQPGGV